MDKKSIQKSKEALRRYKKARLAARQRSSSESSSSSSDSDSSYSSDSDRRNDRRRKKKPPARSSSTSGEERRKREKREHCQKKLEAKRNHLKRKLKEAKLKKRAAVAAAVLSGHSHRSLSPNTQAKLKKLAERKHLRAQSKERREREREKQRAAARERERERAHGHPDAKRQKTPPRVHQMLTREKIIIQARTRSQTPSAERERLRHEQKMRHEEIAIARERERRERERERAERDAARDKERAEALARCQERQRERERIAREKLRREEEEKKYAGERGERILPRTSDREGGPRSFNSRERSMDSERGRHGMPKRDIDPAYEREREYMDVERHGMHDREDMRREREFMGGRRRDLTPGADPYVPRIRDPRDLYEEERPYGRPYIDEPRPGRDREAGWLPRDLHDRNVREPRDFRGVEHDMRFAEEREREHLMRERTLAGRGDWKTNWAGSPNRNSGERKWEDGAVPHAARSGFVGGPKRAAPSTITNPIPNREQRANSEPDWDAGEAAETANKVDNKREAVASREQRDAWVEHDHREPNREKPPLTVGRPAEHLERRWPGDWRDNDEPGLGPIHHRSDRGGRGGFRRGLDHNFRVGPPPLMTLPVAAPGPYGGTPRFPNKRNMTYTNPNLIKKQQALAAAKAAAQAQAAATTAVAAAKAAAQSAANSTTNPSILGQVSSKPNDNDDNEKPEAGEILPEHEEAEAAAEAAAAAAAAAAEAAAAVEANDPKDESTAINNVAEESKASGELSEISDSEDDILSKEERKLKTELDEIACDADNKTEAQIVPEKTDLGGTPDLAERTNDEDEMLDFEEISDGELEEEARHKGVGDALGVDWASLIEETKKQAESAAQTNVEQPTTAKQKWQAHRIILDIGISLRMAGEDYAKRLIADAQQKIEDEASDHQLTEIIKTEIKEEPTTPTAEDEDEDSQATTVPITDTDAENTTNSSEIDKKIDIKTEIKSEEESNAEAPDFSSDQLQSLACSQVAQRQELQEQRQLFTNLCGPDSRALCARQDLKMRRQLCGLPTKEPDLKLPVPPVSEKLKSLALAAFQRSQEV